MLSLGSPHKKPLLTHKGRLTLLLGPPSCGKSTLLKALSGRLRETSILRVSQPAPHLSPGLEHWNINFLDVFQTSGSVQYNGSDLDKFRPSRTSAFVDQVTCLATAP